MRIRDLAGVRKVKGYEDAKELCIRKEFIILELLGNIGRKVRLVSSDFGLQRVGVVERFRYEFETAKRLGT